MIDDAPLTAKEVSDYLDEACERWDELTPTERMPISFAADTQPPPVPPTLRSGENPDGSEAWMTDWLFIEEISIGKR